MFGLIISLQFFQQTDQGGQGPQSIRRTVVSHWIIFLNNSSSSKQPIEQADCSLAHLTHFMVSQPIEHNQVLLGVENYQEDFSVILVVDQPIGPSPWFTGHLTYPLVIQPVEHCCHLCRIENIHEHFLDLQLNLANFQKDLLDLHSQSKEILRRFL